MPQAEDAIVRWTAKVSRHSDVSLRTFLAQRGEEGRSFKFIERAVQKEVFARTVPAFKGTKCRTAKSKARSTTHCAR